MVQAAATMWRSVLSGIMMFGAVVGSVEAEEVLRGGNGDRVDENQIPVREENEEWSPWLLDDGGPEDYHLYWKKMTGKGLYSAFVQGRMFEGREEYRVIFRRVPALPFHWRSYHGLSSEDFDEEDALLTKLGFKCCCRQVFVNGEGQLRIQATWIKTREAFKLDPRYPDKDDNIKEIDWKKFPESTK